MHQSDVDQADVDQAGVDQVEVDRMDGAEVGRIDFRRDDQPPTDAARDTGELHFPAAPAGRSGTDPFVLTCPTTPVLPPAGTGRGPTVLTAAVVATALAVLGVGSWVATRPEPVPVANPVIRRVSVVHPAGTAASRAPWVATQSAEGTGTITLPEHRWVGGTNGARRLLVQVTLADRSGQLHYDPDLIRVTDDRGTDHLSRPLTGRLAAGTLGSGILGPGQTTTGWLAFDVPRGPVTVTLSSWHHEDIAALRLPE